MLTMDRIRGRLVDIELEKVEPFGWVAVGVVMEGLSHEKGMLFEVRASDEAFFA